MQEDLRYLEYFIAEKEYDSHPSNRELADFIDNKFNKEEQNRVIEHLVHCNSCRETVLNVKNYSKRAKISNRAIFAPILLVASSVVIFMLFPKDEITLGTIDLSIAPLTQYQSSSNTYLIDKVVNADSLLEEVLSFKEALKIEAYNQALKAEDKEDATALYKEALMEVLHNINAKERLNQKITIHYRLLQLTKKDSSEFTEYKNILRYELRTYALQKYKDKP